MRSMVRAFWCLREVINIEVQQWLEESRCNTEDPTTECSDVLSLQGEDLGLDMHTDACDVTLNVCLGREFTGEQCPRPHPHPLPPSA